MYSNGSNKWNDNNNVRYHRRGSVARPLPDSPPPSSRPDRPTSARLQRRAAYHFFNAVRATGATEKTKNMKKNCVAHLTFPPDAVSAWASCTNYRLLFLLANLYVGPTLRTSTYVGRKIHPPINCKKGCFRCPDSPISSHCIALCSGRSSSVGRLPDL